MGNGVRHELLVTGSEQSKKIYIEMIREIFLKTCRRFKKLSAADFTGRRFKK
jgi:hypothetical protein